MEKKRDQKPMVRGEIGTSRFPLASCRMVYES